MDIDFTGHVIRVRRNYYRARITTPKGNRRRNVDMEDGIGGDAFGISCEQESRGTS
jgi:hypothetical protein